MAKRFTDTEIWDKEWFMNLSPKLKCLVKFVRDKCDVAGIWQPNWTLANTYVKAENERISEADLIGIDDGNQFKKLSNGQIFCIGFIAFQYGELSEKCPPHKKIISILKKYQLIDDKVLLGYCNPIARVQEEEEDKEEVMEVEKEKEKGVQGDETLSAQFDRFWILYDKNVGKNSSRILWCKLSAEEREIIMKHVPKYVESTPDKAYRKNPETYLYEEVWKDEIITKTKKTVNGNKSSNSGTHRVSQDFSGQL